jgi:hypothetical protein
VMELQRDGVPIVDPPDGWTNDAAMVDASTAGTNTKPMLETRIRRAKTLLSGVAT